LFFVLLGENKEFNREGEKVKEGKRKWREIYRTHSAAAPWSLRGALSVLFIVARGSPEALQPLGFVPIGINCICEIP
jgi:hypothetical protein